MMSRMRHGVNTFCSALDKNKILMYLLLAAYGALHVTSGAILSIYPAEGDALNAASHEDFHVQCVLNASLLAATTAAGLTSQNLSFRFQLSDGRIVAPPEYRMQTELLNATTAELRLKFVELSFHDSRIICYAIGTNISTERQFLVGDKPSKTTLAACEVVNWETLHVVWNIPDRILPRLRYEAWYKNSLEKEVTRCAVSAVSNHSSECSVTNVFERVAPDNVLIVLIIASNVLGSENTTNVLQLKHLVKPAAVKNLSVRPSLLDRSLFIVTFQSPKQDHELVYIIFVDCKPTHFNVSVRIEATSMNYLREELTGLPAYSNCTVWVKAKPSQFGLWGTEANWTFTTPQRVPLGAPEVNQNGFEIHSHLESGTRDVILHFKPLTHEVARGRMSEYRLQYVCRGRSSKLLFPVSTESASTTWLNVSGLQADVDYYITLDARTDVGYNDSLHLNTVFVPKSRDVPAANNSLSVTVLTASTATCSWSVADGYRYTLFWCPATVHYRVCSDVINWEQMPADMTEYNITMPASLSADNFIFGISAEDVHEHRSGISWSNCVTSVSEGSVLPPAVKLLSLSDCCTANILLTKPNCSAENRGLIVAYTVYYCLVGDVASLCSGPVHSMKINFPTLHSTLPISHLQPVQRYLLWTESLAAAGTRSSYNATLIILTRNSIDLHTLSVVLTAVVGLLLFIIIIGVCRMAYRRFTKSSLQTSDTFTNSGKTEDYGDTSAVTVMTRDASTSYFLPEHNYSYPLVAKDDSELTADKENKQNATKCTCLDAGNSSSSTPLLSMDIQKQRILPKIVEGSSPAPQHSELQPSLVLSVGTLNAADEGFSNVTHLSIKRFLPPSSLSGSTEFNSCSFEPDVVLEYDAGARKLSGIQDDGSDATTSPVSEKYFEPKAWPVEFEQDDEKNPNSKMLPLAFDTGDESLDSGMWPTAYDLDKEDAQECSAARKLSLLPPLPSVADDTRVGSPNTLSAEIFDKSSADCISNSEAFTYAGSEIISTF